MSPPRRVIVVGTTGSGTSTLGVVVGGDVPDGAFVVARDGVAVGVCDSHGAWLRLGVSPPGRVIVVGTTGSGKSTLAARIAAVTGAPHVELDGFRHAPGWTLTANAWFDDRIREVAAGAAWVTDGVYLSHTRLTLWPRAELVVWLDLPLRVILPRLVRRSIMRAVRREALWAGNRESLRRLISRDSIVWWAITSHPRNRRRLPGVMAEAASRGTITVRLTSPRAVRAWITAFTASPAEAEPTGRAGVNLTRSRTTRRNAGRRTRW